MKRIKQWFFDLLLYLEDKWISRFTGWFYGDNYPKWESTWFWWVFLHHCEKFKLTPEEEKHVLAKKSNIQGNIR